MVGETAGDSGRTVQRYIRLASLSDGLLEYVDDNKIPMIVGEKLSYLKPQEQEWLLEGIVNSNIFPSKQQAEQLKECSANGKLNQGYIYAVLLKKENSKINVTIPAKKIGNYFPETYWKIFLRKGLSSSLPIIRTACRTASCSGSCLPA